MTCPRCDNLGVVPSHLPFNGGEATFCNCERGSIRRMTANRSAINAYRTSGSDRAIATGPFPDAEVRYCHGQILCTLSLLDRCTRRDLIMRVMSHPGCESRIQIERELDELIASKQVGLDPDWDANSTDGDDIVFHIVKPEWQPTKEQEEACEVRREASRHASIINRWLCVCAFLILCAILYAILATH